MLLDIPEETVSKQEISKQSEIVKYIIHFHNYNACYHVYLAHTEKNRQILLSTQESTYTQSDKIRLKRKYVQNDTIKT